MKGKIRMFLRRVLTLVIVFFQLSAAQVTERCNSNADIAFLVDSSGSISRENYEKVKTFVSNLAASFNISPGGSRVAVVLYSTGATTAIKFDDFTSADSFERAVKLLKHERGFTRIDLALQRAYYDLFGRRGSSRYEVPKIAFLLTDGKQTEDSQALSLGKMARLIKDQGVRIVAIGVGKQVETQELMTIATNEKDVIQADTFDNLLEKVQPIAESACESFLAVPIPEEIDDECQPDVDVAFLVDSSGSISFRNFRKVKNFVVELASKFDISPGGSRAAVVVYSTRATTRIRFTDHSTYGSFANAVQSLRHERGYTRIDLALQMAYFDVFGPRGKPRFLVPKIAFVLTDGEQTRVENQPSLEEVSDRLKKKAGVRIISIGIGKRVNKNQLTVIASSEKDVVIAESFDGLVSEVEPLFQSACKGNEELPRCGTQVDIAFLADSSGSISSTNYRREKAFISAVAKSFGISKDKSRAALVLFSNSASTKIRFEDHSSTVSFTAAVKALPHERGFTRIDRALEVATREVFPNARKGVYQIAMVITDGKQTQMDDTKDLREVSKPLRKAGVRVLALGVGSGVDEKELRLIVERDGDVLRAKSFTEVISRVGALIESTCNLAVPEPCDISADLTFIFGSGGIGAGNFLRLKTVLKTIATSFGISSKRSRASIVTFSDSSASVSASFESFTSTKEFQDALSSLTYKDKRGDIRLALKLAEKRVFPKARKGVAKIAVVVIDGRENDNGQWQDSLLSLRKAGIRVLLLGIGTEIKRESLRQLVEKDDDLVIKDSFITLLKDSVQVAKTTCSAAAPPPCSTPVDLAFIIDSSGSIGRTNYKKQKNFVKEVAKTFGLSPNGSRAAMVLYSNSASVKARFGQYTDPKEFDGAVDSLPYERGLTRIDKALDLTARDIFAQSRSGVPKIAMLITDGTQTAAADAKGLKEASEPLRQAGVRVLAVGIGKGVDREELRLVTESDEDVVVAADFEDLLLKLSNLTSQACRLAGATVPRDFKADILFLVDSSQTISKRKFLQELEFIKAFARKFDVSPEKSRVGVITFGNTPILSIRFEEYGNILSFSEGVNAVPYQGGQKSLNNALVFAARVLDLSKTRPKADKILVLLTDGQQPLGYDPKAGSVEALRQLGVHINVIGAGGNVSMQELRKLTLSPDDLFYSRTFEALILQGPIVFKRTMNVVLSHHQLQHGVFLLESSLFRTRGEFESQINFVKSIAKRLQVSPTGTRAGVILYGDEPKLSIGLNDYSTLPELYNLLDNLAHESGGRQLHKALTLAGETLQKSPQEIPKFVVVILEGQQYSSGSLLLRDAVKPLQALGVTIYVVGIGEKLNRQELYTMVQTSRYIIQVPRFTELLRQMEFIAYRIETTITDPCHETLDVGFVIDASRSVGMDTFSREKNFVKLVSRRFAATSPNTRLGLLVFSDTPKLFVDFADYESKTIEQFQANVAQATFQDGRSRIDLALRAASQDFFTNRRSGVPRVLILVSDGRQSEDPGYYPLATAVKPLQAQRVRIVSVGFGDSVGVENLKEITGSKDRILLDQEINDIDRLQMELVSKACEI